MVGISQALSHHPIICAVIIIAGLLIVIGLAISIRQHRRHKTWKRRFEAHIAKMRRSIEEFGAAPIHAGDTPDQCCIKQSRAEVRFRCRMEAVARDPDLVDETREWFAFAAGCGFEVEDYRCRLEELAACTEAAGNG